MWVVNSTADPGTGGCDETECTLREALAAANANGPGADVIEFDIAGALPVTIRPMAPSCRRSTAAWSSTGGPSRATPGARWWRWTAAWPGPAPGWCSPTPPAGTRVRPHWSGGWSSTVSPATGSVMLRDRSLLVEGCYLGTDPTGTVELGNSGDGIEIDQLHSVQPEVTSGTASCPATAGGASTSSTHELQGGG